MPPCYGGLTLPGRARRTGGAPGIDAPGIDAPGIDAPASHNTDVFKLVKGLSKNYVVLW